MAIDDVETHALEKGVGWARLWRKPHGKVNRGSHEYIPVPMPELAKLPFAGTRETSAT
jgi:hypothetical protein